MLHANLPSLGATNGPIPCAEEFDFIDVGRFTCEHCEKEFLELGNVPTIEQ
jgi:hypothetical protein